MPIKHFNGPIMALNQIRVHSWERAEAPATNRAHEQKGILGTRQEDTGFLTWAGVPPKPSELPPLAVPVVHIMRL